MSTSAVTRLLVVAHRTAATPRLLEGHDGARELLARMAADLDDLGLVPDELLDAGHDRVVVLATLVGRVRRTGAEVRVSSCGVARVREGRIVELRAYPDTAVAQRAVGGSTR